MQPCEISGDLRFHDLADYCLHEVSGARAYVTGHHVARACLFLPFSLPSPHRRVCGALPQCRQIRILLDLAEGISFPNCGLQRS